MDHSQQMGSALHRLLSKLEISVQDAELVSSPYKRKRVQANLESARTLLLNQEKEVSTIQIQNKRQTSQAYLQRERDRVKALSIKLQQLENDALEEQSDSDDEEVATNHGYGPAREDVNDGLETTTTPQLYPETIKALTPQRNMGNELRSRHAPGVSASDNRSAASTTAREQLFAGRSQELSDPSSATQDLSKHEQLLSHNRTTQESLTTSLLTLAQALKQSSNQFSSSLQAEKDILKRAEGSLEGSAKGMEAAERKMGTLRKMSEGQGWLGRLKLYGMIGGLWAACFLIVFVGPKLRF